jgi:membrane-associated phospholipid phosphatase
VGALRRDELIERIAGHRRELLLAAVALLALVLAVDAWLHLVGPLPGERAVGHWWRGWNYNADLPGDLPPIVSIFNDIASPYVAIATVAVAALAVAENLGARWGVLVVAASAVVVWSTLLKHALGPTPLWHELGRPGESYPSGHTAYATALGGFLLVLALWRGQRVLAVAAGAVIVIMGPQRVIAETHLPSDVIGGYAVGAAWLCVVLAVGVPWALRRRDP